MANVNIQTPVYAWETPYITGLGLTYVGTTSFIIGAGSCTDSTASNVITLETPVTISSAVKGAGGLDNGTLAASTLYYVYGIGNSASYNPSLNTNNEDGTQTNPYPGNGIFSLNPPSTGPSLPANYDMYRYAGAIVTDSSSNFLSFVQTQANSSRTMWYDVAISALSGGTSATYANVSLANMVPSAGLEVLMLTAVTPTGAGNSVNLVPYGSTATVGYAVLTGSVASVVATEVLRLPSGSLLSVPYIKYKVTGAVSLGVTGYIDQL